MAGLAVNTDPSIQSPDPLLRLLFFRQRVIDAVSAPDYEQPVSDLMHSVCSVLAHSAVDEEFANFKRLFLPGFRADLHGAPLSQGNGMGLGSGKAAAGQ